MAASSRSIALAAIGIVLILVSVLADSIGLGAHSGFGWKQILGVVVGAVVAIVGVVSGRKA